MEQNAHSSLQDNNISELLVRGEVDGTSLAPAIQKSSAQTTNVGRASSHNRVDTATPAVFGETDTETQNGTRDLSRYSLRCRSVKKDANHSELVPAALITRKRLSHQGITDLQTPQRAYKRIKSSVVEHFINVGDQLSSPASELQYS